MKLRVQYKWPCDDAKYRRWGLVKTRQEECQCKGCTQNRLVKWFFITEARFVEVLEKNILLGFKCKK